MVTLELDEETTINAERCNCRHSGRDGTQCPVSSIERRKGESNLDARRYEGEWNLARLAAHNNGDRRASRNGKGWSAMEPAPAWSGLKRLSIRFAKPEDRARLGGTPNQCRCRIRNEQQLAECIGQGHRGLLGEVAEHWRRQIMAYERQAVERKNIVNGQMR
jgi:hypothetical protein